LDSSDVTFNTSLFTIGAFIIEYDKQVKKCVKELMLLSKNGSVTNVCVSFYDIHLNS